MEPKHGRADLSLKPSMCFDQMQLKSQLLPPAPVGREFPVQNIIIAGKEVTLVGLPLIFQQFTEAGKISHRGKLSELMDTIKIYNPIPADEEPAYPGWYLKRLYELLVQG